MPEIRIEARLFDQLVAGCRTRLPLEACGILLGDAEPAVIAVSELLFIPNASPVPAIAFSFEPGAWIQAVYDAQKRRRAIVGVFHSHPSGPALPSVPDRSGWDGFGSYWIVGLGAPSEDVRVYVKDAADEWQEVRLAVR